MSRSLSAIGLALAVASGLAFFPSAAQAQKGLVYCPAPIDATGCGPIVTALTTDPSPFPDGVATAYDGSSGTVDLATADLSAYAVLVVPSLADGAGTEPYGLLRDQQIVGRLSPAFNGRNAVWSGTPDHGSTNRAAKDALLRNLAGWAKGGGATGRGPGIVVLQDNSDDAAARYSWLRGISGLSVVADTTFEVYSNVQVLTSTGRQLLTNSGGLQIGYTNMAAYGLIASGTGVSNDATGGRTTRVVLVTTAGEASTPSTAMVTTDKEDYQPGDTITVTGAGWEPGETVSLLFHEDVDPPIHPDKILTTVADADGHILNHEYEVEETDVGVRFTLTATGETSGRTAQATFTDDRTITAATVAGGSSVTVVVGQTITASVTASLTSGSGGGQNWFSTSWRYATTSPGGSFSTPCADTPDQTTTGSFSASFSTTAPATTGTYNAYFLAWRMADCSNNPSNLFIISNAVTVNKGNSSTSVATSGSPAVFGSVVLTATVAAAAPASGNPSGTVTFKDGAATLGTGTLSCAAICTATFAASTLTIGGSPHSITAVYAGDASFNGSTAASINQTITKANTTTTVSSPGNPTAFGQSFTFNATVAVQAPGSGTPTGTVQFRVDGSDLGSPVALSGAAATSPSVSGLSVGAHTLAAVYGGDGNFNGSTSANFTHTVGKASQTITFGALADKTYGDADFTVSATASSALLVSFMTSSSSCTVTLGLVHIVSAASNCTITASQAGDATYAAAPDVSQTFNIAKASQTVTFTSTAPTDAHAGGTTYTVTASGGGSGNPVTFSASPSTVCTISVSTVSMVGAGTCTITATQAGNMNYLGSGSVTQSFTVSAKAAQTITFGGLADKTFGDADFVVTASATSHLTVTFAASGDCTVTVATVHLTGAGSCSITASQAGDATYNPAPDVTQTFSIGKGGQTIAFGALAGKSYGDADFPVSATASSTLAVSFAASGKCTVTGTTVHLTGAGSCTITASQAGNTNYNPASDVPQTFTIGKGDQTIAFAALEDKTYGNTDFGVSATASSGLTVSLAASGNCTVAASTVHLTGAGSCTITATQGGNDDYNAAEGVPRSFTIGKAPLAFSFTAKDKVYDGTEAAEITGSTLGSGVIGTDVVTLVNGTASFADKNAGDGKTVTGKGFTLGGADGGNYVLNPAETTTKANISRRPLTVTATGINKEYDGTPDATVTLGDNRVSGDALTFTYKAAFADKKAGTDKPVSVSDITINGGDDKNNYDLSNTTATTKANIDQKPLAFSFTAENKEYDGSATAVIASSTLGKGVIEGDAVTLVNGTASFADKNAGDGKTVTGKGFTLGGADGGNYVLDPAETTTKANISRRPIAVEAEPKTKVYGDGDPNLTYKVTSSKNLVSGDAFIGALTRDGGELVAGSPYAIKQGTLDAGPNYDLTFTGSALTITRAPLTVTANSAPKVFGNLVPPASGSIVGIKLSDNITATYAAYVLAGGTALVTPTTSVGVYPIIPTLSDPDGKLPNYELTITNGTLTVQKAPPAFSNITIPSVVFGQGSSTVSGNLKYVTNVPGAVVPTGSVSITVNGQTQTGTVQSDGNFTATFNTSTFPVGGISGLPVALSYNGSDPNFTTAGSSGAMIVRYNRAAGTRFLQPVNLYPDPRSSFKITSTIPVKFQLFLADGVTPYGGANATIQLTRLSITVTDQVNEEIITTPADDGVTFRYDTSGRQYIYNMGTKTLGSGTYTISANLNDGGPPITATIELRSK